MNPLELRNKRWPVLLIVALAMVSTAAVSVVDWHDPDPRVCQAIVAGADLEMPDLLQLLGDL
jgi:hypothetical protein